jgi:hypothetical protein
MLPVIEALLAGVAVGIINRFLARLEHECPEAASVAAHRDDSSSSTASSGTAEIPHFH